MVKCPKCQTVYNEALNMGCPQCTGNISRASGFSKTVMPGIGSQVPVQPTAPPATPMAGATTLPVGAYAVPTGNSGTFSKTAPPAFAGMDSSQNAVAGGAFSKTQPPADGRFVRTQYLGEHATVKSEMRVTGWIVQTEGAAAGKEYRIHAGYNYIGREEGDIRIEGDDYISSAKDSQIYYDAVTAAFYISHVNGANAVRVNNEPVISGSAKLKAYDILTIGKSRFVFVPLCCEQFKWEEEV